MIKRRNWHEELIYYSNETGEVKSIPADWTSIVDNDPFLILANGKSLLHIQNLIELVALVESAKKSKTKNKGD